MRLSVLDLVHVRTDQSSRDAVAASIRLAEVADRMGYTRFWTGEHHNTPFMASTSPAVMIAHLAARTAQIRLGSGGVLLPNHQPLVVAEQFALLEALAPGRIDLGIGRATGSDDALVVAALRGSHPGITAPDAFAGDLEEVAALMTAGGVHHASGEEHGVLAATPMPMSTPPLWLLGSSASSAQLAASMGLPYVYAHHFGRGNTQEALALYRSQFTPSSLNPEPTTMLTVTAVVAPTRSEAEALLLPALRLLNLRALADPPPGRVELVEDAREGPVLQSSAPAEAIRSRAIIGAPKEAADQLHSLAAEYDIDEVMLCPLGSERRGTYPPDFTSQGDDAQDAGARTTLRSRAAIRTRVGRDGACDTDRSLTAGSRPLPGAVRKLRKVRRLISRETRHRYAAQTAVAVRQVLASHFLSHTRGSDLQCRRAM
ncbi:luciferase family oxidoreductase group 1 [Mycobacterium sp. URHB0021]